MNLYSKGHLQLLKSLLQHDVKFILIGGHAAIYYGVNRNTGDLDILIEPDAVDILNYTPGIEFSSAYQNAHEINFSDLQFKIIDIHDLIRNKENLKREGEKSLLDQYDAEVLKKILKRKQED